MATTPLGIWIPGPDPATEPITDIDDIFRNLGETVDAAVTARGITTCLSTARPTTGLFDGRMIFETDTGFYRIRRGTRWVFMGGDSRAEFTSAANFQVGSGSIWGTGALTLDAAASSISAARPATVEATGAEVVRLAEQGNYFIEARVAYGAIVPVRMFIRITAGPTTGIEEEQTRAVGTGDTHVGASTIITTRVANTRVAMSTYQQSGGVMGQQTRLKITRMPG